MPGNESYGYHGDGLDGERDLTSSYPSLERDGDPFFHSPIAPEPERHEDWQVYNPTKAPVDTSEAYKLAARSDAETTPQSDNDIFRDIMNKEFGEPGQ